VNAGRAAVAPLRSAPFRRYLLGQLPSLTGSWAQVVALSWWVESLDPKALGWVVALQFLPSLVLGPWFGVVADRHDRRRLLILAECGLGLVAAAYALTSLTGALTLPVICVLATAWGVINALDTPARRSLVPALVPPDQAASASALTGTVLLLGMTAGSALGGALVAAAGVTAAFAVNAASFLADIAVLSTIRAGASPRVKRAPRQVREGFSYVAHTPRLRAPLVALALIATLAFTMQVSVPALVRVSFAGGPAQLGAALTALAAGSLTGTLIRAARGTPGPRALPLATAIMTCGLAATTIAPALPAALAGLATVGIGWSCFLGTAIAVLQSADPRMLGRVMSLFAVVLLGGMSAGAPVASSLSASLGPRAPFIAGTAAAIAALAVASRGAGPASGRPARQLAGLSAGPVATPDRHVIKAGRGRRRRTGPAREVTLGARHREHRAPRRRRRRALHRRPHRRAARTGPRTGPGGPDPAGAGAERSCQRRCPVSTLGCGHRVRPRVHPAPHRCGWQPARRRGQRCRAGRLRRQQPAVHHPGGRERVDHRPGERPTAVVRADPPARSPRRQPRPADTGRGRARG